MNDTNVNMTRVSIRNNNGTGFASWFSQTFITDSSFVGNTFGFKDSFVSCMVACWILTSGLHLFNYYFLVRASALPLYFSQPAVSLFSLGNATLQTVRILRNRQAVNDVSTTTSNESL
jgi:hypothetical protein